MKPGRIAVGVHDVDLGCDGAERVELGGVLDAGHDIGVGPRTDLPAFVAIADELAVALRAEANVVPRFGAIGRNGKTLRARGDELDRAG